MRNIIMVCVVFGILGFSQEGEAKEEKEGDVTITWNNGMSLKYYVGAKVERRSGDSRLWIIERGKAKYVAGDTFFVIGDLLPTLKVLPSVESPSASGASNAQLY